MGYSEIKLPKVSSQHHLAALTLASLSTRHTPNRSYTIKALSVEAKTKEALENEAHPILKLKKSKRTRDRS